MNSQSHLAELPPDEIRIDGKTQPREQIDLFTVSDYAEAMKARAIFPPIEVVHDGKHYWLWDGFHRWHAVQQAKLPTIACRIQNGTVDDARWLALGANQTHGLRRTNADKRRAVEEALRMKPQMSDRAIAEHCGVAHPMVGEARLRLEESTSQPTTRQGRDGRTIDTSNIGKPRSTDHQLQRDDIPESVHIWAEHDLPSSTRNTEAERKRREEARLAELEAAPPTPDLPEWDIIHGDCVKTLADQGNGIASLVFADPPYNIGIDYGHGTTADLLPTETYLSWVTAWLRECHRILNSTGSIWVLINDEYAAEYVVILKSLGFTLRNWVKWYETFGVNCTDKFNRTSRHLLYGVKDTKRFTFNRETVLVPSARQTIYGDRRADPEGKVMDDVWTDIPRLAGTHSERIPSFPTQLPVTLVQRIVRVSSCPGDLVIDPFNGSGTTGAAALSLGRRYRGFDKSPEFVRLSRLRLKSVQKEML